MQPAAESCLKLAKCGAIEQASDRCPSELWRMAPQKPAQRVLRGLQPSSWACGRQSQGPPSEPGARTR